MLSFTCFGKMQGNFRYPKEDGGLPAWFDAMEKKVMKGADFKSVHLMRPNFTVNCVSAENVGQWKEVMPAVYRASEFSDGLMTDKKDVALAMANADCPAAIIYDEGAERLALLHCGFKCLVQSDGGIGIFEEFFSKYGFNKGTVKVRMAFGIGPCCYGIDTLPSLHGNALVEQLPLAIAERGPRVGKPSIDLFGLMRMQLRKIGLHEHQLESFMMPKCTACHQVNDNRAFHSNVYDGPDGGRNLVLAWMH